VKARGSVRRMYEVGMTGRVRGDEIIVNGRNEWYKKNRKFFDITHKLNTTSK
jgi:hypothetical protein